MPEDTAETERLRATSGLVRDETMQRWREVAGIAAEATERPEKRQEEPGVAKRPDTPERPVESPLVRLEDAE